ncbi:uncharacterized protein LOC126820512 isoform X2 [Patella vulgata]|uniref:uncharacterized protein LOC126820512 isoform X2 n=1 Tax=Patella vulgata TaxID=6465 RepID=UPI00217F2915|nr:uncharacterized protein LOC126820512 isoform X2 [Patella vulgata]
MAEETGMSEIYLGHILNNDISRSNGNQVACNGAEAILDEALPLQTNSVDLNKGKITNTGQNPQYDGPTMRNINGSENVMPKNIDDTIISDHNSDTRPGADKNGSAYYLDDETKVKCLATPVKDVNKTVATKTKLEMCDKKILPNTLPITTTNSENNLNASLDGVTPDRVDISENQVSPDNNLNTSLHGATSNRVNISQAAPENRRKNTRVKELSKDSIDYLNDQLSFGCNTKSWECIANYKGWHHGKIRIHSQKCTWQRLDPFQELIMHKDFADYKVSELLEHLEKIPRVDLLHDFDERW